MNSRNNKIMNRIQAFVALFVIFAAFASTIECAPDEHSRQDGSSIPLYRGNISPREQGVKFIDLENLPRHDDQLTGQGNTSPQMYDAINSGSSVVIINGHPRDPRHPRDPHHPRDPIYPSGSVVTINGNPRDPYHPRDPRHPRDPSYPQSASIANANTPRHEHDCYYPYRSPKLLYCYYWVIIGKRAQTEGDDK